MNATTNNAATVPATEVLCRFDPAKNKPVVFVASNMQGGEIESWISGDAIMSPLSYYHSTLPLSAADEEVLAKRFARHFHAGHVLIRHRLPRTARFVPNRLANRSTVAAVAAEAVVLPFTPLEAAPAPVLALVTPPTPAPTVKRSTSKKAAAKRGGRKPAAKPIETQEASPSRADTMRRAADNAPAPTTPAPSLEQKVDQLASLFAQLLERVSLPATATE